MTATAGNPISVAENRFSLNEGSLVRRTVLHVAVFVIGTALFLAVASLVLTSIGKRVVNPPEKSASADEPASGSADDAPVTAPTSKLNMRPPRGKKKPADAVKPSEEEDQ